MQSSKIGQCHQLGHQVFYGVQVSGREARLAYKVRMEYASQRHIPYVYTLVTGYVENKRIWCPHNQSLTHSLPDLAPSGQGVTPIVR